MSQPCELNITDYGATASDSAVNTAAIQKAVDTCHDAGGGRVVCPAGEFITGTILLKSNVELYLAPGCTLKGSGDLKDYPEFTSPGYNHVNGPEKSSKCLIGATQAHNIAITGSGTIDGSGISFYADIPEGKTKRDKPDTPRPRIIMWHKCSNGRVENVTLTNSACWTCWFMQCDILAIHGIKINCDHSMRNIDGMDIDGCKNVTVSDCILNTEDDSIVLRSMQGLYDSPCVCENITITNCVLESTCQGVRVGCPNDGTIRNAAISNLTIRGNRGIVFQNPHRYCRENSLGAADIYDIQFSNININVKDMPIWMNVEEGIKLTRLSDVTYSNLHITSGKPIVIEGNSESPIENIHLSNIKMHNDGGQSPVLSHCNNIKLNNVEISNASDD